MSNRRSVLATEVGNDGRYSSSSSIAPAALSGGTVVVFFRTGGIDCCCDIRPELYGVVSSSVLGDDATGVGGLCSRNGEGPWAHAQLGQILIDSSSLFSCSRSFRAD